MENDVDPILMKLLKILAGISCYILYTLSIL